jgi:hypothetical protein
LGVEESADSLAATHAAKSFLEAFTAQVCYALRPVSIPTNPMDIKVKPVKVLVVAATVKEKTTMGFKAV